MACAFMQTKAPLVLQRCFGLRRGGCQPGSGCHAFQLLPRHSWCRRSWPARLLGMWAAMLALEASAVLVAGRTRWTWCGLAAGSRWFALFGVLPVRGEQAPQSQALSAAAGFGAFIDDGVNDPGLEPRSMPWCPTQFVLRWDNCLSKLTNGQ